MYKKYCTEVRYRLSRSIKRMNNDRFYAKKDNNIKEYEECKTKEYKVDTLMYSCLEFSVPVPGVGEDRLNTTGAYHCPYVMAKTLKDIGYPRVSKDVLNRLNEYYDRELSPWPDSRDHFFQRVFNYPPKVVESRLRAYKDYMNNLKHKNKCPFDEDTLDVIEYIYQFVKNFNDDNWMENIRELKDILEELKNFPYDLTTLCDNIELTLRKNFAKELRESVTPTWEELQKQEGRIKVLDGQDFRLLVHDGGRHIVTGREDNIGFCASLIDQNNTITYKAHGGAIQYVFIDIQDDDISCAASTDSYTGNDRALFSNNKDFEFIDIDTFQERTLYDSYAGYNEINFAYSTKIKPKAIVCYDEVDQQSLNFAEENDLQIILIKTECYPNMCKCRSDREGMQRPVKEK